MTGGFWEMGFVVIVGMEVRSENERAMEDVARHCLAECTRELCFLLVGWRSVLLFFLSCSIAFALGIMAQEKTKIR
jgi:hypothetical protein